MVNDFDPGLTDDSLADYNTWITTVEAIESRDGGVLRVERGYSDHLVAQLIEKSRQESIVEYCPRDSSERFVSRGSFERWRNKERGRFPYFLTDASDEMAGIVWYGPSELDEDVLPGFSAVTRPNHTFAIRLYDGFSGRSLARGFARASMNDYLEQFAISGDLDEFNGFHLETDADNQGAIRLYEKIGFQRIDEDEGKDRVVMVLMPEDAYRFIGVAPVE